jgi:hypothetical protein
MLVRNRIGVNDGIHRPQNRFVYLPDDSELTPFGPRSKIGHKLAALLVRKPHLSWLVAFRAPADWRSAALWSIEADELRRGWFGRVQFFVLTESPRAVPEPHCAYQQLKSDGGELRTVHRLIQVERPVSGTGGAFILRDVIDQRCTEVVS